MGNIAIKAGAAGPAANMTIAHNHFYAGHGMSIGSNTDGGVNHVRVSDLSIDGADNGIRIKSDRSRGGVVQDVAYENVCMRNVQNPIVLTSMYTTFDGNKLPDYRDIVLKNVHSVTPGWLTLLGLDAQHRIEVSLDNVTVDGVKREQITAANSVVRMAGGNLAWEGNGVSVTKLGGGAAPVNCDGRFVRFPEIPTAPEAKVTIPAGGQDAVCLGIGHGRLLLDPARHRRGAGGRRGDFGDARDVPRSVDHQQAEHHHPQQLPGREPYGDCRR